MAKKHVRVKRELPSAYKHTRAIVMYTAKRMATDSLGVGEETGVWARWQMPTHQPLCVTKTGVWVNC